MSDSKKTSGQNQKKLQGKNGRNRGERNGNRRDQRRKSGRRNHPRTSANESPLAGMVNGRGEQMQKAFHQEGQLKVARHGNVRIFPQTLAWDPIPGVEYDISVIWIKDGRIGKALPICPDAVTDGSVLDNNQYAARLRQRLTFRRENRKGRDKMIAVAKHGPMVFMQERDAHDLPAGTYTVDLVERDSYCLARLVKTAEESAQVQSSEMGSFGQLLSQVEGVVSLMPTVTRKFARIRNGIADPTENDLDVEEQAVDCWKLLGLEPEASETAVRRAFGELSKKQHPKNILDRFARARVEVNPAAKANYEFAFEALKAARNRALEICRSRNSKADKGTPVAGSKGKQIAKKAKAASQAEQFCKETVSWPLKRMIEEIKNGQATLESGQYRMLLPDGRSVKPTLAIWKAIQSQLQEMSDHASKHCCRAVELAELDPQLPLLASYQVSGNELTVTEGGCTHLGYVVHEQTCWSHAMAKKLVELLKGGLSAEVTEVPAEKFEQAKKAYSDSLKS